MSATDDVRRLSDELARDPASLVFLQLGEALRRQGQVDYALKVAVRGLERHPHNAEAHDLLARIAVDRGELERAFDEWDMVLRLAPDHIGALKGLGFICFRQGRAPEAERYLAAATAADPADQSIASALAHVRAQLRPPAASPAAPSAAPHGAPGRRPSAPTPAFLGAVAPESAAPPRAPQPTPARAVQSPQDARYLFAEIIGDGDQTALLLDEQGLVMAGAYLSADGRDVAQDVGAELSGVSDEARRAMRHLDLGSWTAIVFETEVATVAMAPAPQDGLLLVAASREAPLGFVRRLLDRASMRTRAWLGVA
jgi:tetratricopeptide (TPR) repeat protein